MNYWMNHQQQFAEFISKRKRGAQNVAVR